MTNEESIAPLAVSESQAGRMLGISQRTFWELRNRGEIRQIKIGRLTRYAVSDLQLFLELKRIETEEDVDVRDEPSK